VLEEDLHGYLVSLLMLDDFYEGGWGIKWHLAAWEHVAAERDNREDTEESGQLPEKDGGPVQGEVEGLGRGRGGEGGFEETQGGRPGTRRGIYNHLSSIFFSQTGHILRTAQDFVQDHLCLFRPEHLAYCMTYFIINSILNTLPPLTLDL
jgi:hypothetical protein